eukprot:TRINITY_DN64642_c0_g1_i1.p1 TRINITY_DN64642_c0_g1~~TRINITY_DN64642_c0_g1_i1.p1  ORF type:complete len:532 (-),score=83.09 TRINITY_DN64642_c0_g1_i1:117-1553(-)
MATKRLLGSLEPRVPSPRASADAPSAVDIGLLRAWRREALVRCLRSDAVGLTHHILEMLDDVPPPPIACVKDKDGVVLNCMSAGIDGFGAETNGVTSAGRRAPQRLESSKDIAALALDSSGAPVLASVGYDGLLLVWDLRTLSPPAVHAFAEPACQKPRQLFGSRVGGRCVWLDSTVDRLAVGYLDGTVEIWALSSRALMVTCVAVILESTRWTTVGHYSDVRNLVGVPQGTSMNQGPPFWDGNIASVDAFGMVCVWRENGHCIMCVNAAGVVDANNQSKLTRQRLLPPSAGSLGSLDVSSAVNGLAAASVEGTDLIFCGFAHDIVVFCVPHGDIAFMLSTAAAALGSVPQMLLAFTVFRSDCGSQGGKLKIVGASEGGGMLLWEVPSGRRNVAEDVGAFRLPQLLTLPCSNQVGTAIASHGLGTVLWASRLKDNKSLEIRWSDMGQEGSRPVVFHGATRLAPEIKTPATLFAGRWRL